MPTLTFTTGPDTYTVTAAGTYNLSFLAGDDTLTVNGGTFTTATMGEDADRVTLRSGDALVSGQSGADRFDLYANGVEADGGADADLFNVRGGSNQILTGGIGVDRFNFYATAALILIHGSEGSDDFFGYNQVITGNIYGDAGNDYFLGFRYGGGSTVQVHGGTGNDVFRYDATSPGVFLENPGEGTDSIQLARGRSLALPDNIENISVQGFSGSLAGLADLSGNALNNVIIGHANVENLYGWDGNDTLSAKGGDDYLAGGIGNDRLDGGSGNDLMFGGIGNDTLNGRTGTDTMHGQAGDDTFYVDALSDAVWELVGEGTDTVRVSVMAYILPDHVENGIVFGAPGLLMYGNTLNNLMIGNAGGDDLRGDTGNDTLKGGGGDDWLYGEAGDDIIDGGAGTDTMSGSAGDDFYYANLGSDVVTESAGGGIDTVYSTAGLYELPAEVENGIIGAAASPGAWLLGNDGHNILTGSNNQDLIDARDGDDTVYGNGGNDTIYGGGGGDTIYGGAGNDTISAGTGWDLNLHGGAGSDTFYYSSVSESANAWFSSDYIQDYEGGDLSTPVDLIDVSSIDANTTIAGNQAFTTVAIGTGAAGEIWFVDNGSGEWSIYGDVDGGGADLLIALHMSSGSVIWGFW